MGTHPVLGKAEMTTLRHPQRAHHRACQLGPRVSPATDLQTLSRRIPSPEGRSNPAHRLFLSSTALDGPSTARQDARPPRRDDGPTGPRRAARLQKIELPLAVALTAPGAAREAIRTWLQGRHCDEASADSAALLVTELVTNAVLHAHGSGLCLTVDETTTNGMHVAVRDDSCVDPVGPGDAPGWDQTSGRGLLLVEALSSCWGWEPLPTGKRVWFELPFRADPEH
jgi:anti-sigma regulatory factor (Ser/Thr protein kinase)